MVVNFNISQNILFFIYCIGKYIFLVLKMVEELLSSIYGTILEHPPSISVLCMSEMQDGPV